MAIGPRHEVAGLTRERGELSFEARIDGDPKPIWFRTPSQLTPNADAALAACLLPAMRCGGTLTLSDPLSPRILRTQREVQAIQRLWSLGWDSGQPPLREVEVVAPARERSEPSGPRRVAAFFDGGVGAWSTLLDNPEVTDLIFVPGFDFPGDAHQAGLADTAGKLGLEHHLVETNLRELSDPLVPWEAYSGCALASVALFLAPLFERVLIATASDYEVQVPVGTSRLVDQLWSTEQLEVVEDGGRRNRLDRVRRVADHPVARSTLRVCRENPGEAHNCGRCRECLLTMVSLEALGARESVTTFPAELDLEAVAALEISEPSPLAAWEDVLEAAREAGRDDLERAIEPPLAGGKRELGLPPDHRTRHRPGPGALSGGIGVMPGSGGGSPPPLFATPETAAAIGEAAAVCVLIGGYDGSGNYGDIAQLAAALELLAPLSAGMLMLPVVEHRFAASHVTLAPGLPHPADRVLYFDPSAADGGGIVPVEAAAELSYAACYLYGGGYLNRSWGERKLGMLRATERLLSASGAERICRVATGLQVDPEWLNALARIDLQALRSFALLGARDRPSSEALARLEPVGQVLETGDDAVGLLHHHRPSREPAETGGGLRVNVHFAQHEWVTADPETSFDFFAGFLRGLARSAETTVVAQPLIAYDDPRVNERPALERLAETCAQAGIAVEAPLLLRPAALGAAAPLLREADLALSSSYHAALTSLMLGVPAILVQNNPYYEQKANALIESFELPDQFALGSGDDPAAAAAAIAALLAGEGAAHLRTGVATGVARMSRRRAEAEMAVLGEVATEGMRTLGVQLRSPAGEVAERRAREAEARTAAAEAELQTILSSRSWRLGSPLRRLAAWLRRRR